MKVVERRAEQESSVIFSVEGSAAPSFSEERSVEIKHSVQLASQVKSQLSLLEDLQQRRLFLLNEVGGVIKKA